MQEKSGNWTTDTDNGGKNFKFAVVGSDGEYQRRSALIEERTPGAGASPTPLLKCPRLRAGAATTVTSEFRQ